MYIKSDIEYMYISVLRYIYFCIALFVRPLFIDDAGAGRAASSQRSRPKAPARIDAGTIDAPAPASADGFRFVRIICNYSNKQPPRAGLNDARTPDHYRRE